MKKIVILAINFFFLWVPLGWAQPSGTGTISDQKICLSLKETSREIFQETCKATPVDRPLLIQKLSGEGYIYQIIGTIDEETRQLFRQLSLLELQQGKSILLPEYLRLLDHLEQTPETMSFVKVGIEKFLYTKNGNFLTQGLRQQFQDPSIDIFAHDYLDKAFSRLSEQEYRLYLPLLIEASFWEHLKNRGSNFHGSHRSWTVELVYLIKKGLMDFGDANFSAYAKKILLHSAQNEMAFSQEIIFKFPSVKAFLRASPSMLLAKFQEDEMLITAGPFGGDRDLLVEKAAKLGSVHARLKIIKRDIHYLLNRLELPERSGFSTSFAYLQELADEKNTSAILFLALLYEAGLGVSENLEEAYYWKIVYTLLTQKTSQQPNPAYFDDLGLYQFPFLRIEASLAQGQKQEIYQKAVSFVSGR